MIFIWKTGLFIVGVICLEVGRAVGTFNSVWDLFLTRSEERLLALASLASH